MSDGQWRKAHAQQELRDGDVMLVAVAVCEKGLRRSTAVRDFWELSVVTVHCDEHYFDLECSGGPFGWEWSDVEWYIPIAELTSSLPPVKEQFK